MGELMWSSNFWDSDMIHLESVTSTYGTISSTLEHWDVGENAKIKRNKLRETFRYIYIYGHDQVDSNERDEMAEAEVW